MEAKFKFDIHNKRTGEIYTNKNLKETAKLLKSFEAIIEVESMREKTASVYKNEQWNEYYYVECVSGNSQVAFINLAKELTSGS